MRFHRFRFFFLLSILFIMMSYYRIMGWEKNQMTDDQLNLANKMILFTHANHLTHVIPFIRFLRRTKKNTKKTLSMFVFKWVHLAVDCHCVFCVRIVICLRFVFNIRWHTPWTTAEMITINQRINKRRVNSKLIPSCINDSNNNNPTFRLPTDYE